MKQAPDSNATFGTAVRFGLTLVFSLGLLVSSGCARIHAANGKAASFDQANRGWGPIVGSVQTKEEPEVVVLNTASYKVSPSIFSKAHLTVVPVSENGSSIGKQSEALSSAPKVNPFDHPTAKVPLPEEMPRIKDTRGIPIQDKLAVLESQIRNSAPQAPEEVAPRGSAPATHSEISDPISPPASVSSGPTENQARAKLADPKPSLPAAATEKPEQGQSSAKPKSGIVESAAKLKTDSEGSAGFSKYQFSFAREIWLLIVILGGVFATLWFRLEYDFGSRARRSNSRPYRR